MSNLFYYNNLLYSPLQLDPSAFYTPNCHNSYIFLPLLQSSPSFLEFQSQPVCTPTITVMDSDHLDKEVLVSNNCKKGRLSVKGHSSKK
jgi:hypothetical protein